MPIFFCQGVLHSRSYVKATPFHHKLLYFLSSSTIKYIPNSSNQDSFTVTYLVNSCGFNPKKALSASKYMKIDAPEKPDSVRAFFKQHGFTNTQISSLVKRYPPVLLSHPEKTLLPKLEFLSSVGFSSTDVADIIIATPVILKTSLNKKIIPYFNFFNTLLQSSERKITALKRLTMLLRCDIEGSLKPKIKILREIGVSESSILLLLTYQHMVFTIATDRFGKMVEKVKQMGFNPWETKFVLAIHGLSSMSKSTWETKVEVYKKWGLSEDDIFLAFQKNPWCMMASVDKISSIMDFLINKMGFDCSVILQRPAIVLCSLEKRIVPRCLFYQELLDKGLIKKEDYSLSSLLGYSNKQFLRKITRDYEEAAPEMLKLYKEMLAPSK